MFGRLMGWYTLYTSLGVLVPDGVLSGAMVQYTLCVQVLRSFILAALLHGNRAAGVSQNLRHATRNETSGYATMVHGRDAIRIAVRQLSQTWKLRHYDVIDDIITRKL